MKHQSLSELTQIADVAPEKPAMSKRERLERWAECLERDPERRLRSLDGIEYGPKARRREARESDSPISVAFADPVLREEGLKSDELGDALDFFEMSFGDAHRVLCSCMHGRTMQASDVAQRVRDVVNPGLPLFPIVLGLAGAAAALPMLTHLFR